MSTFSMPDRQYRFGAPYRDTDECSYFTTSTASSNMTADNVPGPGRNLGNLYGFLGRRLENAVGRAAERLGYGPHQAIIRIHRQRLITASKHMTGNWEELNQIEKILRDGRLLDMSEHHYSLLRGVSSRLPSSKEKDKVKKYCKRLIKYVRSNVESTKRQALDNIIELAFEDQYVRELLTGMGAVNVIESLQNDPTLWINSGASLQSSSYRALLVLDDAEVHTLALKLKRNQDISDCLRSLSDYVRHPKYSFVAIRYLRQFPNFIVFIVHDIAKTMDANCDIVDFAECDRIFEFWLKRGYGATRIDGWADVLEIIFRYAEKLPRTVSSGPVQKWLRDLQTGSADTKTKEGFLAHYIMAELLKGIAAANKSGDEDLWATYPHQLLLSLLQSQPDIALSQFAFEAYNFPRRVPGVEMLKHLCEKLSTFASSTDNQIQERTRHCAKVLLTADIYCHTAMLKALSLTQIPYSTDFTSFVEEAQRLDNNRTFFFASHPFFSRHCDAEDRLLHIVNHNSDKPCDITRGCLMEHELIFRWDEVLTLVLKRGTAFSSAGHYPILAGHTVDGERAYIARARFSKHYESVNCSITEGTKPENLRIQTKQSWKGDYEERTPVSLDVYVLRWAPDMYPDRMYHNLGLGASGPLSWKPLEDAEDSLLPRTEAYISDLDTTESEMTIA